MTTATSPAEWVNATAAAAILDVPGPRTVRRLAERGLITTRDIPGVRDRFLLSDIERIRQESVRPASQEG